MIKYYLLRRIQLIKELELTFYRVWPHHLENNRSIILKLELSICRNH